MAKPKVARRLTTIVSIDVVGYSRLMEADEAGTLEQLKAHRDVTDPKIGEYKGRIVSTAGDSLLVEFPSATDAVSCALDVQSIMAERNTEVPEDRRMEIRIGVNLGDVMIEGDDIFGNGVNVAARLQGLAEPGGICISQPVYDQVRHSLEAGYDDLGPQKVKNIKEPVRAYRVLRGSEAPGAVSPATEAPVLELPDKPSIAVLPFENMSGDPEQEYFADGIAEDIITSLSKSSSMLVIARSSTFTYKGKPVKVQRVAEELGVRYVLEGSVRKVGNRVRVTAQLIDATTGSHLWAERYERDFEDIFALQDEITLNVASSLVAELTAGQSARMVRRQTNDLQAWSYNAQALPYVNRLTREDNILARELLEKAIEHDPDFSMPYTNMAWTHWQDAAWGYSDSREESLAKAGELARKALALDDANAVAYTVLAGIELYNRKHDDAITVATKAVKLAPSNSFAHAILGWVQQFAERPEDAIRSFETAMRLSPRYPDWYLANLGISFRLAGRHDEAIDAYTKTLDREPGPAISSICHMDMALTHAALGREAEARVQVAMLAKVAPNFTVTRVRLASLFKDAARVERDLATLRALGLPE